MSSSVQQWAAHRSLRREDSRYGVHRRLLVSYLGEDAALEAVLDSSLPHACMAGILSSLLNSLISRDICDNPDVSRGNIYRWIRASSLGLTSIAPSTSFTFLMRISARNVVPRLQSQFSLVLLPTAS